MTLTHDEEICDEELKECTKESFEAKHVSLSTLEDVIDVVGNGRVQLAIVLCVCLATIAPTIQDFLLYFLTLDTDWTCSKVSSSSCNFTRVVSIDSSNYNDRCSMTDKQWRYVVPSENSLVTTFDLSCARDHWIYLIMTVTYSGTVLGSLIIGYVADKFGRQKMLLYSNLLQITFNLLSVLSTDIEMYAVFQFIIGFFRGGTYHMGFLLVTEIVSERWQSWAGFSIWLFYSFGQITLGFIAKYVRSWKLLVILASAPFLIFIPPLFFIPESLDWLVSKGKEKQLQDCIRTYLKYGKSKKKNTETLYTVPKQDVENDQEKGFGRSLAQMFYSAKSTFVALTFCLGWFTVVIVYTGVSLVSDVITKNVYRNFIILATIETPASFICMFLSRYFSLKHLTWLPLGLGASSILSVAFINASHDLKILRLFLAVFAKLSSTIAYNCLTLWSVQYYPVKIRGTVVCLFSLVSCLGMIATPWISIGLQNYGMRYPFYVMGGAPIVAGLLLAFIPTSSVDVKEDETAMGDWVIRNETNLDTKC